MFFAVALANLVLPSHVAHVAQLLLLSFSVLIQPLISFFSGDSFPKRRFCSGGNCLESI